MSSSQKTVKYIAMALAVLLAFFIISGIASAAMAVLSLVSGESSVFSNDKDNDFSQTFTGVKSLQVDNSTGSLRIQVGDTFKVEAKDVSKHFEARITGDGKLIVSEDDESNWIFHIGNPDSRITITLPSDFVAEEAKLNTGAGSVVINALKAQYLFISAGAGSIKGSNLTAEEVKIEGGVGSVKLEKVYFKDASFECGVGSLDVKGVLIGDNTIECGIGKVDLRLEGEVEDYRLEVDAGLGNVKLNGKKISNSYQSNSNAKNKIRIEGGIGSVDLRIDD